MSDDKRPALDGPDDLAAQPAGSDGLVATGGKVLRDSDLGGDVAEMAKAVLDEAAASRKDPNRRCPVFGGQVNRRARRIYEIAKQVVDPEC